MVCEHLAPLERALLEQGIPVTFRGQAWSDNCREWVYFGVVLDLAALQKQFGLADCVQIHENSDPHSGLERGFVCIRCKDGIMGELKV
jgi:hypothetical protein